MKILLKIILISLFVSLTLSHGQYRILGEKKDEFCKDLFKEVDSEDPNGQPYKSQELVTQSERQSAESIRQKLQIGRSKQEAKADIKKMLNDNDYMNYVNSLMFVAIPFIILLALGILGSITYMLCFFLETHCCKRDVKKKPYSDSDLGRPAICVFFFGLVAIGMIIYGYLIAQDFANMSDILKCSLISILDEVVYGAEIGSYSWLGISNAGGPIQQIIRELDVVAEKQELYYSDSAWIEQDLENIYNANDGIYNYYNGKQVKSPNPNPGAGATGFVDSKYIVNDLGDKTQDGTTVFNIKNGIDVSSAVWAASAQETVNSSAKIKINLESMKDSLNEGRKNIQSTSDDFVKLIETSEKKMEKQDTTNALLTAFLNVFFAAQLTGATLGFLGVSFTHCSGPRPKCRVLLHLGWLIMSIMMIVGLVLSVILVPTGVMLTETCDWLSDFLKDEAEFNDPSYTFLEPDIMQKISECKFGEGDLSGQFGINEQFDDINAMLDAIAVTTGLSDPDTGVDITQSTQSIDTEIARIVAIKEGRVIDSEELDDNNADIAINNLTKWSDHSATDSYQASLGSCAKTQDEYVFASSQCVYTTQYDNTNTNPGQNIPNETCIVVKDITLLEQATRYSAIGTGTGACDPQTEQKINSYFKALYEYDMARTSFFLSIQNDLNDLKTQTSTYNGRLNTFIADTEQFSSDISALTAAINDPSTGLLSRFNCKFLGQSMDRVYDALCVAFISPIFKGILSTAVASVCMFFSSFFAFVLAIRYARKTRASKVAKKSKVQQAPKKA